MTGIDAHFAFLSISGLIFRSAVLYICDGYAFFHALYPAGQAKGANPAGWTPNRRTILANGLLGVFGYTLILVAFTIGKVSYVVGLRKDTMMIRVLFIGNSHTYLHYLPEMVEKLSTAGSPADKILTDQVTGEGAGLKWHWNNFPTRARIRSANWDFVVLQDRSGGPLEEKEALFACARQFHRLIKEQQAGTVLYMTWALQNQPETQPQIAAAYRSIAAELGAFTAPVGLAWQQVLQQKPALQLYHRDGRHASAAGAYLAACVFYGLFQKKSPLGLPGTLSLHNRPKVRLSPQDAALLQQAAWEQTRAVLFEKS